MSSIHDMHIIMDKYYTLMLHCTAKANLNMEKLKGYAYKIH